MMDIRKIWCCLLGMIIAWAGVCISQVQAQEFTSPNILNQPCTICDIRDAHIVDLDGDGDQDILLNKFTPPFLGWLENQDTGFGKLETIHLSMESVEDRYTGQKLTVSDLNQDDKPDLISGRYWFKNLGNASFSGPKAVADFPGTGPDFLGKSKVADINGDGTPDVVNFWTVNWFVWYAGDTTSRYADIVFDLQEWIIPKDQDVPASNGEPTYSLSDVDGDGDSDILGLFSWETRESRFVWYENLDQEKGFGSRQIIDRSTNHSTYNHGWSPDGMQAVDLDGDEDRDLLLLHSDYSNQEEGYISWYENIDNKNSYEPRSRPQSPIGGSSYEVLDVDDDGDRDIVSNKPEVSKEKKDLDGDNDKDLLEERISKVIWAENDGTGSFDTTHIINKGKRAFHTIDTGDINGDGHSDLMYLTDNQVIWHPREPNGGLGAPRSMGQKGKIQHPEELKATEINGDVKTDLLVRSRLGGEDNTYNWYKNKGTQYAVPDKVKNPALTLNQFFPMVDTVDNDSRPDMVSFVKDSYDTGFADLGIFKHKTQTGEFSFTEYVGDCGVGGLGLTDIDNDGDLDAIFSHFKREILAVYKNENGTFDGSDNVIIDGNNTAPVIEIADVDRDGDKDLIASNGTLIWYERKEKSWSWSSDGSEMFSDPKTIDSDPPSFYERYQRKLAFQQRLNIEDMDMDGDGDVVLDNYVYEYLDGEGSFGGPYALAENTENLLNITKITDLDVDGDPDLVGFTALKFFRSSYEEMNMSDERDIWWRENKRGHFESRKTIIEGIKRPRMLEVSDANNDGGPDVFYLSVNRKTIQWFENKVAVAQETMTADQTASFDQTGVRIHLSDQSTGSGTVTVSHPEDGPENTEGIQESFVSRSRVIIKHDDQLQVGQNSKVFFDLTRFNDLSTPSSITVYKRDSIDTGTFETVSSTYNENTGEIVVTTSHFSEFVFGSSRNRAPVVKQALSDTTVALNENNFITYLRDVFEDPNGDEVSYSAYPYDSTKVTANIKHDSLFVHTATRDTVRLRVTATDPSGDSVNTVFNISGGVRPFVVNPIPDTTVALDSEDLYISLDPVFSDPQGEKLRYWISKEDAPVDARIDKNFIRVYEFGPLYNTREGTVSVTAMDPDQHKGIASFHITVRDSLVPLDSFKDKTYTLSATDTLQLTDYFGLGTPPIHYKRSVADTGIIKTHVSNDELIFEAQAAGSTNVTITAIDSLGSTEQQTFNVRVKSILKMPFAHQSGWNLVGIPVSKDQNHYSSLFSHAIENTLFKYEGAYKKRDTVRTGEGYWLRFEKAGKGLIKGKPVKKLQISLEKGWNLITGPIDSVARSAIRDPNNILIEQTLFGYAGAYKLRDTLAPGEGYWVLADTSGHIELKAEDSQRKRNSTPATDEFSKIIISDAIGNSQTLYFNGTLPEAADPQSYSLPPQPPKGAFDVRLKGDRLLIEPAKAVVQLRGVNGPLTLKVVGKPGMKNRFHITIGDDEKTLASGESTQITDQSVRRITVSSSDYGRNAPDQYRLKGNYPNPFNPTTTIKYGLPEAAKVRLTIYSINGRQVARPVNERQEAGWHKVQFDASRLASGVYMYRLQAGAFSKTRKMTVIK